MPLDWDSIVEDLGPRLFKYFASRHSREESSDMTQETLIRLVKKVDSGEFDMSRGTIRMYAFGIAHYVRLENSKPNLRVSLNDENGETRPCNEKETYAQSHQIDDGIYMNQRAHALRQALNSLPQTQQSILSLVIDKELTHSEIGNILNLPVGTVKSHIHRAKSLLKIEVEKILGESHV